VAGFKGRDIYLSEPYRPYAWPETYTQTVDYPVVGLGSIDTTLVVLTTGTPYYLQGSHPDAMVLVTSDLEQACASKRSIVSMDGVVVYASPDGLVALTPSGSRILTEQLFERADWQAFDPASMHAYGHDRQYIAFYDNGVDQGCIIQGCIIYDFVTGSISQSSIYADAAFRDLQDDALYLLDGSKNVVSWEGGSAQAYTWKSKRFTMPRETSFALAQIYAESYSDLTFKFYGDGVLLHTQTVTGRGHFRLPATPAHDIEFQLEGTDEVFAVNIAQSAEELAQV